MLSLSLLFFQWIYYKNISHYFVHSPINGHLIIGQYWVILESCYEHLTTGFYMGMHFHLFDRMYNCRRVGSYSRRKQHTGLLLIVAFHPCQQLMRSIFLILCILITSSAMQETHIWSLGQEDPLDKELVTYSRILPWEIPYTEKPGGLQFKGLQELDMT